MKTILAFSGSSRLNSLNKMVLCKAVDYARESGAEVEILDLRALSLPIYDGDYEEANGLTEGARVLKNAMTNADGFLIASPEYNSGPTPLLLNAIDWASRSESENEPPLKAFKGKTAGLIAASPSPLGGLRSLWTLRTLLQNINVVVVPTMAAVGQASADLFQSEEFDTSSHAKRVKSTVDELLATHRNS
ncbi:MAG: NAD(P)H-dependent oxidoreductase [Kiritimatiellae bacterium]|jgi:chromate reductase|nr:NAD(P)H-dependent oxidoreductase [Kiritimatiellia bacterium]